MEKENIIFNGKTYEIPSDKKRPSFPFFRSVYDALTIDDSSTAEEKLNFIMGMCKYAFCFEPPTTETFSKLGQMLWIMTQPVLANSNEGYLNGFKGAEFGKMGAVPNKHTKKAPKTPKTPKTEKDKYRDCVFLTKDEYARLVAEYGEAGTLWMIEKLDNYKASTGKAFANDYKAILTWFVEKWQKQAPTINLNAIKATEKAEKAERERAQDIHDEEAKAFQRTLSKYGISAREYLQLSGLFDGTRSEAEIMEAINEARQRQTKIV